MDIASLVGLSATTLSALNSGLDGAEKLRKMMKGREATSPEELALILKIYDQLIDAKRSQAETEEALRTLLRETSERQDRDAEFDRYQLVATPDGDKVYQLKEGREQGEPPHCICPNCKSDGKKSILQTQGTLLSCPSCGTLFKWKDEAVTRNRMRRTTGGW